MTVPTWVSYQASDRRYDAMPYRRAGRSGLLLPSVSLGLWHNFGSDRSFDGQRAIVRRAFDLGITHFDLANNYGPPYGAAESAFGEILSRDLLPYRDEIAVSTKAGYDMWPGPYGDGGSRKYLRASLDQSLERLQLDYVDVFYSHRPDPDTPIEETAGALADAVQHGKALYVGLSNYDPVQTRAAVAVLAERGVKVDVHQPRFSMFDRTAESGLLSTLRELGIGCIAYSPLAQGMLTERYLKGIPADSRAATSHFLSEDRIGEQYLTRARGLRDIAHRRGQTLAQLAISWILRHPEVSSALLGASSVAQLEANVAALGGPTLTDEELEEIDRFAVHGTGLKKQ